VISAWVVDTYLTSPLCAPARAQFGFTSPGATRIDFKKVVSGAHQIIVDGTQGSGNHYQAWPFFTYLTNNPDNVQGLGIYAVRNMIRKHRRNSNDSPLHDLQNVLGQMKVQRIVGRYWARMAYVDIGHPTAQAKFNSERSSINYANLNSSGNGWRVKPTRAPKYMGANIIPLKLTNTPLSVRVSSNQPFTATLVVSSRNGISYIELENGVATTQVTSEDQASLVVVNTPVNLIQYDPFSITGAVTQALDYGVELMGATA
jgi:hypothetical protein